MLGCEPLPMTLPTVEASRRLEREEGSGLFTQSQSHSSYRSTKYAMFILLNIIKRTVKIEIYQYTTYNNVNNYFPRLPSRSSFPDRFQYWTPV